MRPLIITNFEFIDAEQFIVAELYGEDGHLLDCVIMQIDPVNVIPLIRDFARQYRIETVEMWTSTPEIFTKSLSEVGVAGEIKHPSKTASTRAAIVQREDFLREEYGIRKQEPSEPKPKLPKWRALLVAHLRKILEKLEGADKYGQV